MAMAAICLATVILGGALSACVVFGPARLAGNASGLTTADRLMAENDVRSTLVGADLTDAKLGDASLTGVTADNTTTWPDGFTPPQPTT